MIIEVYLEHLGINFGIYRNIIAYAIIYILTYYQVIKSIPDWIKQLYC